MKGLWDIVSNEKIIARFCAQFSPPLKYAKTARINNVAIPDAWTTSGWDDKLGLGFTVLAYGGAMHAYLEASGRLEEAGHAGRVFARALGLYRRPLPPPVSELWRNLQFDGLDVMPKDGDFTTDDFTALYQAACIALRRARNGEND